MSGRTTRAIPVVVCLLAGLYVSLAAAPSSAVGNDCVPNNPLAPKAEMFATDFTEEIDDPTDQRLRDRLDQFAAQVSGTIFANAAIPVGSELVHGVFWSDDRQKTTYEPSRDFHVACVDEHDLTQIAEQLAARYNQESVLTFIDLPADDPAADSFVARVPGFNVRRFHDALAADTTARSPLGGGSVTEDGVLVLVVAVDDTVLAQRVVAGAGGVLDMSTVQHGRSEFVSAP